jgi:ATP-dependent RNA helicase HelY
VILKEADVEVGTIYEVAMGPTLVVESKFLPSYNMALNLLRVYAPEEAEALMQRSFGQFQKRLAAEQTKERLANVRVQLADIRQMWDDPEVSIEDVAQYFKLEDRRRAIRIELKRLRREGAAERRGRRGTRHTRAITPAGRMIQRLEVEAKGLLERQHKLKVVRSPRFGELLQRYAEIRTLQKELDAGQREVTGQMDEYARKLRRLCKILTETGFLARDRPTDKGLFAARVYGENTILVTEAVWLGWLEGLTPEELCAVLVMLAAEDRERGRNRGARGPRRYPTPAIAQTARLIRSLYFRFADLENDLDEPNLRTPSHDYIDFAYRWATGESLDKIPLPSNIDIGDAIKAMKGLYSLLRQLEWALRVAKSPVHETVSRAVAQMERDVIKRTY